MPPQQRQPPKKIMFSSSVLNGIAEESEAVNDPYKYVDFDEPDYKYDPSKISSDPLAYADVRRFEVQNIDRRIVLGSPSPRRPNHFSTLGR